MASSKTKTILVVDDDHDIHNYYQALLGTQGYKIASAFNGKHGLQKIQEQMPDLLILDMEMPEMTGHDLLIELKKFASDLPVIVISGKKGTQQDPEIQNSSQVRRFIAKPANIKELLETVTDILAT